MNKSSVAMRTAVVFLFHMMKKQLEMNQSRISQLRINGTILIFNRLLNEYHCACKSFFLLMIDLRIANVMFILAFKITNDVINTN
jgi:hypothetical protein